MKKELEVKVTEGKTFKLKTGEKYLLFIDRNALTQDNAHQLMNALHRMGIDEALTVLIDGNPQDVILVKKK